MSTLLIVDDSRTSRKLLREIVESMGFDTIEEAANGLEGVEKYKALKPDLVTLDITMPELDGIGALTQIMAQDRAAKVVMVSASAQNSKVVESLKLGAIDFIPKPYEEKFVLEHLRRAAEMGR